MAAGKGSLFLLRLFGKNASHVPGKLALKIDEDILGDLGKPEHLICVTGTNGKTTTSNFIATVLESSGRKVTNNSFGGNVQAGIGSALMLHSTFLGRHKYPWGVIEVDERSSPLVYPYMTPDWLVVNNIMRDSIKRNAHTEFISFILNSCIPAQTALVLNGDDLICSALAPQCKKRVYFGVSAEIPDSFDRSAARDVVYCPECGMAVGETDRFCTNCGAKLPNKQGDD